MSVCINCGKECEGVLCAECAGNVNVENLIAEVCAYHPERCENELWNSIAAGMINKFNFRDIGFALAHMLPSPRKEYMTLYCLLRKSFKDYVRKESRGWLYDNIEILRGEGLTDSEKRTANLAYFYNLYYDYRYAEAEKLAENMSGGLSPNEAYAVADFYVKTRRYEKADMIIGNALKSCTDEAYQAQLNELLEESKNRQLGKENGGKDEYLPSAPENREKYAEFMRSIGIDVQLPVKKEKPKRERISKADYPDLPMYRDAGFRDFVAYDLETTGKFPEFDSIIEIGAVRVVNGVVSEAENFTFQTFAKPYKAAVSEDITELTGITRDMVENAPEMWDAFSAFADFLGDDILVGFNNNKFDDKFLVRAGRYAKRVISNKSFDVLTYAKDTAGKTGYSGDNYKLGSLSAYFGIENPRAHRALADALTTARLYLAILEKAGDTEEISLDELLSGFGEV